MSIWLVTATNIEVTLEKDGSCTVKDNGRGIPVDMHAKGVSAERLVFTTLHAGGKVRQFCIQDKRRSSRRWFFCCKRPV